MSLLRIEGFEAAASANAQDISDYLTRRSVSPTTVTGSLLSDDGRHFGRSCKIASNTSQQMFSLPYTASATVVVGFAFKCSRNGSITADILRLYDGSTLHLGMRLSSTGVITVHRNGSVLTGESSDGAIPADTWVYVEFKATIADSASGSYEVRVNGVTVASGSGLDTRNSGNASVDRVAFCGGFGVSGHTSTWFDDIYVLNTSGSANNDFLGVQVVEAVYPTSDVQSDWTPSTGTDNFAVVDDNPANGDTDYVESSTVTNKDLYGMGNLSSITGNIKGIQISADVRVTDASPMDVELIVKENVTESAFADQTVSSESYTTISDIAETNPDTSAAWSVAEVNNMQVGIEVKA